MDPNFASFPGLQISHADLVMTHGVTPSKCVVRCIPQSTNQTHGTLAFGEAGITKLQFLDCALDQGNTTAPLQKRGQRIELRILDRRWKWKGKRVDGRYNTRRNDCIPVTGTAHNYFELIQKLLDALGETNYEIDLPYPFLDAPTVDWDGIRADLELARIIEQIGCLVYLGLDNATHVVPFGSGPTYPPNGREREPRVEFNPSSLPVTIRAKYGPTRYQSKLRLEAVGLDNTGQVKPIAQLSYTPSTGWRKEVPDIFNGVVDQFDRELAKRTVFHWYRIKNQANGTLYLPGSTGETITAITDILPLYPDLIMPQAMALSQTDTFDNNPSSKPRVEGIFFNDDLTGWNEQQGGYSLWDTYFELDCQRGIVRFEQPVFQVATDGYQDEAELYLECSYSARANSTSSAWYFYYDIPSGVNTDPLAGVAQVTREDIYKWVVEVYTSSRSKTAAGYYSNIASMQVHGQQLAESYRHKFTSLPRSDMQWTGIIPYSINGNVHQMRWVVGGSGPAMTYGGQNGEIATWGPPATERRMREEAQRVMEDWLE